MTFEMTLNLIWKEKLDASVKRQCQARGVFLIKHYDKVKTIKGVLNS